MVDKRGEIREILTDFSHGRCFDLVSGAECDCFTLSKEGTKHCFANKNDVVDCLMQRLNPLVAIPVKGKLPSTRNAVNKSYNDYMLGQEDMQKAGWVKVEKLVKEMTNDR